MATTKAASGKTTSFGYQNKTLMEVKVTPYNLKPTTGYAKVTDSATNVVLSNKEAPLDQGELLSYKCTAIEKVNTDLTIRQPAPVQSGVQYIVKLDEILRTTNEAGMTVDEPVVAYLTIRHQASGNITNDLVTEVVQRLLGACMREDGSYRFDDLMRSALNPVED